MENAYQWFESLPATLRDKAYLSGVEAAWSRDDAIAIIEWAQGRGLDVLGIEVWLATNPGPTLPGPYVWEPSAGRGGQPGRVAAAAEQAVDFIRTFQWHVDDVASHGREPYFNLTFD